jgi:hypothetical protein
MYRGLAVYGHEFGSGAGLRAGSGGKVLDPNRIIRLGRTNISLTFLSRTNLTYALTLALYLQTKKCEY